jgi:hypothetical protein
MRPCLSREGIHILDATQDLNLEKIVNFSRSKDSVGNFVFSYKKKSGSGDFAPSKTVEFTLPVFEDELPAIFTCEFFFSFVETEEAATTAWTFIMPNFGTYVNEKKSAAVLDRLRVAELDEFAIRGELSITKQDDSWKYKENKAL